MHAFCTHAANRFLEALDDVLQTHPVLRARGLTLQSSRQTLVTVREVRGVRVYKQFFQQVVLPAGLEKSLVQGGVFFGSDDRGDVNERVVGVLTGQGQHDAVPLALEMTTIHVHDLPPKMTQHELEKLAGVVGRSVSLRAKGRALTEA